MEAKGEKLCPERVTLPGATARDNQRGPRNGRLNMLVFPRHVIIANIDASDEQLDMIQCKKM